MRLKKRIRNVFRAIGKDARAWVWRLRRRMRKPVTVRTKQGVFTLSPEVDDSISRQLFVKREFELDLIETVTGRFANDAGKDSPGVLVDIGANNGVISIGMLMRGHASHAIAIEPDPKNYSNLLRNVRNNGLEQHITAVNYAISDSDATLEFELSEKNYGDHRVRKEAFDPSRPEIADESRRQVIQVESKTLDGLLSSLDPTITQDVFLIWVDVQGHEGYVFSGARDILSKGIPVVSEIWPYGINRSGMPLETFNEIVTSIWKFYWVRRRGRFVRYPIEMFYTFLDELGIEGADDNVVFTHD